MTVRGAHATRSLKPVHCLDHSDRGHDLHLCYRSAIVAGGPLYNSVVRSICGLLAQRSKGVIGIGVVGQEKIRMKRSKLESLRIEIIEIFST